MYSLCKYSYIKQADTEDNSPQDTESQLDPLMKEQSLDEGDDIGEAAEESPDQSISSAMPTDSGVGEGDGAPMIQDGEFLYINVFIHTLINWNITKMFTLILKYKQAFF